MGRELILSHDLGTSGDKACLFDYNGELVASAHRTYPTFYPAAGYAEQSPEDWWEAVKSSTEEVVKKSGVSPYDIKSISFSAHSLGCIPIDNQGRLLKGNTIIWMDSRSIKEAEYIKSRYGDRKHYEITGNSFDLSLYPCSKIMWIKKNEPDVYKNTYKFIGTKEYIIYKMTGRIGITDYSEAGMSGLFSLKTHDYDPQLLEICQLSREKLCTPYPCTHIVGELTKKAAKELSLKEGTPVILGTLDNLCCAIGAGGMSRNIFVTYIGTAGWLGCNVERPLMSPNFKANIMFLKDKNYYVSIHSHSAGASFQWVIENLCSYLEEEAKKHNKSPYELASELAMKVKPGSENLFFMPSMFSGGTIFSNPHLGGAYIGLRTHHKTGHIVRAAMEGVGYDLMMGLEFFKEMGMDPKEVRMVGGGAKSDVWREIFASMYGVPVSRPKHTQNIGSLGAAILAGIGAGVFKEFDAVDEIISPSDPIEPDIEAREAYKKLLNTYIKLFEVLIPVYEEIGN